jgi:recombination protein RecT
VSNAQSNVLAVRNMLGGVNLAEALPDKRLTAERFARVAMTTLQTNDALARCHPRTIVACLVECAQLGLMPDAALGEAYLVPFKGNAVLIIGYRGMLKLIRQSGDISTVFAYAVHEGDLFKYYLGLEPNIVHTPDYDNPKRESNPITHVYAVAKFKDGGSQFVVMTKAEVESIRGRSRSGSKGPWQTDYVAMALKTVIRRLAKTLPMSTNANRAIHVDEQADRGEQRIEVPAEIVKDAVVQIEGEQREPIDDIPFGEDEPPSDN